jgi:hypothetical protein
LKQIFYEQIRQKRSFNYKKNCKVCTQIYVKTKKKKKKKTTGLGFFQPCLQPHCAVRVIQRLKEGGLQLRQERLQHGARLAQQDRQRLCNSDRDELFNPFLSFCDRI